MTRPRPAAANDVVPARVVLNVGSGPPDPARLHGAFRGRDWRELRFDIEPAMRPDIVGDMVDMRAGVGDGGFDAVWSSHNLEHLAAHQVPAALAEFARVLKAGGFALITCPDMEAVARLVVDHGLDAVAYRSKAGPVTARDMLWGHGASIAAGHGFMAHRTGFTLESLARLVLDAGFHEVRLLRDRYALWALCLKTEGGLSAVEPFFRETEQRAFFDGDEGAGPAPAGRTAR